MNKTDILNIVKLEIDKWDPVDLLEMGAPQDEYKEEIYMITNRINNKSTVDEITNSIYNVLIEMFGESTFGDINRLKYECYKVAKEIYFKLNQGANT